MSFLFYDELNVVEILKLHLKKMQEVIKLK